MVQVVHGVRAVRCAAGRAGRGPQLRCMAVLALALIGLPGTSRAGAREKPRLDSWAWSPDGRHIGVVVRGAPDAGTYLSVVDAETFQEVMRLEQDSERELGARGLVMLSPASSYWGPKGERLCVPLYPDGLRFLAFTGRWGAAIRTSGWVYESAWSPSGNLLAYSARSEGPDEGDKEVLCLARADGEVVFSEERPAYDLLWDPSERFVAFWGRSPSRRWPTALFLADVEQQRVRPVADWAPVCRGYAWSETGDAVVFSTYGRVFCRAGARGEVLDRGETEAAFGLSDVVITSYAPGGRSLAAITQVRNVRQGSDGRARISYSLYLVGAGATKPRLVTEAQSLEDPRWSPDGRNLLFGRGEQMLSLVDAAGDAVRDVLSLGGADGLD